MDKECARKRVNKKHKRFLRILCRKFKKHRMIMNKLSLNYFLFL